MKLTIDIEPFIKQRMDEIHAAIEAGCHAILEEAFEAGFHYGDAFRAEHDGHTVHPEDFPPNFDQWIAEFIERHRQD
jgi:hypothetical protein